MKGLISKIGSKIKKSKDTEADRLSQQLEAEHKKFSRREAVRQPKAAEPKPDDAVTYDNAPDSEGGTYHVHELLKVQLPAGSKFDLKL